MRKTYLTLLALPFAACDFGQNIQPWEYVCDADSTVCWYQTPGDPRNTPENDPRNDTTNVKEH